MLRALVSAEGPATLAVLHEALGGHPNTVRVQLEHLVAGGFATEVQLASSGRGRPARAYAATIAGRQVALEDPERADQAALVEAVAEHLAGAPDPVASARAVGLGWGRRLVAAERDGLFAVLAGQGFTPERRTDAIALRTCPLLDSARQWPEVVCSIHQGLIDAVSPEPQELLPFATPGACLVRPRPPAAGPHAAG